MGESERVGEGIEFWFECYVCVCAQLTHAHADIFCARASLCLGVNACVCVSVCVGAGAFLWACHFPMSFAISCTLACLRVLFRTLAPPSLCKYAACLCICVVVVGEEGGLCENVCADV